MQRRSRRGCRPDAFLRHDQQVGLAFEIVQDVRADRPAGPLALTDQQRTLTRGDKINLLLVAPPGPDPFRQER